MLSFNLPIHSVGTGVPGGECCSVFLCMRPVNKCTRDRNYDLFNKCFCECLFFLLIIILLVINTAIRLINSTRFITFSTCLDYLPQSSKNSKVCYPSSNFIFFILFLITIFGNMLILICELTVVIVILTFKIYTKSLLNFLCMYSVFFQKLNPTVQIISLWFFNLILLSMDIQTNPGPVPCPPVSSFSNSFFSFCNWNLNTLSKDNFYRISLIEAHNSIFNYDIISLCETSLNEETKIPENSFKNYQFKSANHSSGEKKGGVGIFYKNDLPLKIRHDLSFEECIVCELKFGRKNIFFTVLYRNPIYKVDSPEFVSFMANVEDLYKKIKCEKPYATFFTGDFNAHSLNWWTEGDNTNEGIELDKLFTDLNLTQVISEPTNFQEHCRPSCIDLIITDQPNLVLNSGVRDSLDPTCKHQITFCKINFSMPPPPVYNREVWLYNNADILSITRAASLFPWRERLNCIFDPSLQVELLNETILNIMSNFVPHKVIKIKPSEPEWINGEIKKMLKKQNRIYRKYKKNGFRDEDKLTLDIFRNECADAIKKSKEKYLLNLGNKLCDNSNGQKSYWKIVNNLLNKCKIPRIPPLLVGDKFVTCVKDKATLFNNFFVKQCQPFENTSILPNFFLRTDKQLQSFDISDDEILKILSSLKTNKAHGPDDISVSMIKLCGNELVLPLKLIFVNILRTGIFPKQWKRANVTPVHKKENKQLIKNYRPISLLPILAKVFERIIFKHLYNHLIENDLITKNQSGFRPGDSVTNQLLFLVHKIFESFDNLENFDVRSVFLDMSKAFDKVWHKGLIFKLKQNGVTGNLLILMENYLSNREQRVALNGMFSEWGKINSGVPQGSVLGPLLFLVYINDLEEGIKSQIKFFADDTSLFSIVRNPEISTEELNHDLGLINNWAFQWKMSFNPDPNKPAEEVVFSNKREGCFHPPLFFNNIEVKRVNEHKHLGLTLDSKLNFGSHIKENIAKAMTGVGVIRYLSSYIPVRTLDQIYKMYVRPHFDFCDVIYNLPVKQDIFTSKMNLSFWMEKIEKVQYQAAIAVTGTWKTTSREKIYDELGWEPLWKRRWFRHLVQFYKIQNGLTPSYLTELVPPLRAHLYGLRSNNVLQSYKCNRNIFKNSFYPYGTELWNKIGPELRQLPSLVKFKMVILKLVRFKKKSIFGLHDPLYVRRLFQLRVGLSPLRYHKRGFKDNPSITCSCNVSAETTEHFFLECISLNETRDRLFEVINPILEINNFLFNKSELCRFLLYGNDELSDDVNKAVLTETLNFIKRSHRFDPVND